MIIIPISDVHTELAPHLFRDEEIRAMFSFLPKLFESKQTIVLVAAGDIGRNFSGVLWLQRVIQNFPGLRVVFVPGNHEYYGSQLEDLYHQYKDIQTEIGSILEQDLHILASNYTIIDNVLFVGDTLWTDCHKQDPAVMLEVQDAMNDYVYIYNSHGKPITVGTTVDKHYNQSKRIFKVLGNLAQIRKSRKDLKVAVVTHHSPLLPTNEADLLGYAFHCTDVQGKLELSENIPDYWFFGHTHSSLCTRRDYAHGSCEFISNQLGYTFENLTQTHYQKGFFIEVK